MSTNQKVIGLLESCKGIIVEEVERFEAVTKPLEPTIEEDKALREDVHALVMELAPRFLALLARHRRIVNNVLRAAQHYLQCSANATGRMAATLDTFLADEEL